MRVGSGQQFHYYCWGHDTETSGNKEDDLGGGGVPVSPRFTGMHEIPPTHVTCIHRQIDL